MYESFYGLTGSPFSLLPDADFLYPSKRHRRAINALEYGILTQAGFVGVITNSSASLGQLLHWVSSAFNLDTHKEPVELYDQFIAFLLSQYAKGKRTALVVDEAQNLSAEMLEELRMLSNVNNEKDQLLQIILLGQSELLQTLKRPDLRQFVQRIVIHCHLDSLSPPETASYIHHRLGVAGAKAIIFHDMACAAVHYFSYGVPRLINLLCDQTMMYGYSDDLKTISYQTVVDVVKDRQQSGLSPFRTLPESWTWAMTPLELTELVDDIKRGEAA
jgi:type II secretory pathway predicted ATPase ExeA